MFSRPLGFTQSVEDDLISLVDLSFTSKKYAEEQNPFDTLTKASATSEEAPSEGATSPSSMWSGSSRQSSSPSSTSKTQHSNANVPARRPLISAHTFPKYEHEERLIGQESQETKGTIFQLWPMEVPAQTFRLEAPFIYATRTRNIPRYQLQQELDLNRSVSKLDIRAVLPRETRSLSMPAIHAPRDRQIRYNEEQTVYSIDLFEMRGQKAGALPGSIQMTSGKSLWGGQWTRFWHVTRCKAQHHNCDYRGECEPEKHLLYGVKKGVWEDAGGMVVAREEREEMGAWNANQSFVGKGAGIDRMGYVLEMTDETERDGKKRDLVIACWVMGLWMAEKLRWEGN
jgi:hypothetical protein